MSARTVFMFAGQGSQHFQMGRELFDTHRVFRESMTRLDAIAHTICGRHVLDAIHSAGKADVFDRTLLTHPAIFMIEVSLARCLMHEGVEPDLVLGASLGCFAAAAIGGYIDVETAVAAVLEQAAAVEASCEPGGMIAILAEPSLYDEDFLHRHCELAGINFGTHFTVSGPRTALDAVASTLKQRGVVHQRLAVSLAFHSRWIDRAQQRFDAFMRSVPLHKGALPLVCCEQAALLNELPEGFFWRAVRRPMRFRDAVDALERQGRHRYVDAGPSGTLATFVKYSLGRDSGSTTHAVLTPYGQDRRNLGALLASR